MDDVFGSTKKMAQENASKKVTVTEQKTTGRASDTHLLFFATMSATYMYAI